MRINLQGNKRDLFLSWSFYFFLTLCYFFPCVSITVIKFQFFECNSNFGCNILGWKSWNPAVLFFYVSIEKKIQESFCFCVYLYFHKLPCFSYLYCCFPMWGEVGIRPLLSLQPGWCQQDRLLAEDTLSPSRSSHPGAALHQAAASNGTGQ